MGLGCRVFFVGSDDSLRRVPLSRFERLYFRNDNSERFPEYAGERVRYALIAVEVKDRKPVAVRHASYSVIKFDAEGGLDADERDRSARLGMDMMSWLSPGPKGGPLVDARSRFARKQYEREFKWRPTPQLEQAIAEAILGEGDKGRPLKLV